MSLHNHTHTDDLLSCILALSFNELTPAADQTPQWNINMYTQTLQTDKKKHI